MEDETHASDTTSVSDFKRTLDATNNIWNQTERVSGTRRQQVIAALLGTCIVFSATLTGVPHLDAPLTTAMYLFAFAIPCLGLEFIATTYRVKANADKYTHLAMGTFVATMVAIGDTLGFIAAVLGITATFAHSIGIAPAIAFGTFLFMLVAFWIVGTVSIVREAIQIAKRRKP